MKKDIIFTINPGTTTTRCALYKIYEDDIQCVCEEQIEHPDHEIECFECISEQFDYRFELVQEFLERHKEYSENVVACAGRGGMLTPVPAGVIKINHELVNFSLRTPVYKHASNLGAPLAFRVAEQYRVDAYIADPVSVDQFSPEARLSGCTIFDRFSFVHALNIRATTRKLAQDLDKSFDELSVVVAHLGAGFSIAAVHNGQIVDNSNRMECSPFTPERAGGLPPIPLIEACYSGNYSKNELLRKLYGAGGVYGYLGTRDIRNVELMIEQGDAKARLVYEAMIYQIAKTIGSMASVMNFALDGIVLTGGMANSARLKEMLEKKLHRLAPMYIYPGSNENQALAEAAYSVINHREKYMDWPIEKNNLKSKVNCA